MHIALDLLNKPNGSFVGQIHDHLGNLAPGSRGALLENYFDNIRNRNITDNAEYGHWKVKVVWPEYTS